jgi:hypothetical protein
LRARFDDGLCDKITLTGKMERSEVGKKNK